MHSFRIRVLIDVVAVCRLSAGASVPPWVLSSPLFSITRTAEELSIVCRAESIPDEVQREGPWRVLQLEGPIPFALTGVLAAVLNPLAERGISIFAVSTFDTDYILVRSVDVEAAVSALRAAGHQIA